MTAASEAEDQERFIIIGPVPSGSLGHWLTQAELAGVDAHIKYGNIVSAAGSLALEEPSPSYLDPSIEFVEYDLNEPCSFQSVTSRDQLLLKPHFWDFQARFQPDSTKAIATTVFQRLVDTSELKFIADGSYSVFVGERSSFPGIVLKKIRAEHKVPDTSKPDHGKVSRDRIDQLSSYAIVAGSLLEAAPQVRQTSLLGAAMRKLMNPLLDKLADQIQD